MRAQIFYISCSVVVEHGEVRPHYNIKSRRRTPSLGGITVHISYKTHTTTTLLNVIPSHSSSVYHVSVKRSPPNVRNPRNWHPSHMFGQKQIPWLKEGTQTTLTDLYKSRTSWCHSYPKNTHYIHPRWSRYFPNHLIFKHLQPPRNTAPNTNTK